MKFLADGMLGKLARWLRMQGQDVTFSVRFSDKVLLDLTKVEERGLLTKDFVLYKRAISRGLDSFYVEGKTESNRLAEVSKRYGLTLSVDMAKSHCPICNGTHLTKMVSKVRVLRGAVSAGGVTICRMAY